MNITIASPTPARDVRPDQSVQHAGETWHVDEVRHRRGDVVAIAMRPATRTGGRRSIVTHAADALVDVLPTIEQLDELASTIATALGNTWSITTHGPGPEQQ